jgi:hypothetical protein
MQASTRVVRGFKEKRADESVERTKSLIYSSDPVVERGSMITKDQRVGDMNNEEDITK